MNPLTQIKNTQKASKFEVLQGLSETASWHAKFKHSAYVFAGGLPYDLTEGDILAIFAQYGELVDVNLVKDKHSGKPRGFAFVAYEDQRSTTLAVDNLSGARLTGRTIRVEHVDNYKRKRAEVEGLEESPEYSRKHPSSTPAHSSLATKRGTRQTSEQPTADPTDADAPWMNSNSIVNILAQSPSTPGPPASAIEKAKKPLKEANVKQGKQDRKASKHHKARKASKAAAKHKRGQRKGHSRQISRACSQALH